MNPSKTPLLVITLTLIITCSSGATYGSGAMRLDNNVWYMRQNNWMREPQQNNNNGARCNPNNCRCSQQYIPFCGTDGVTYSNRCQLQCARECDSNVRVRFEGVCPEPYIHDNGYKQNNALPRPTKVGTSLNVVDRNPYNNGLLQASATSRQPSSPFQPRQSYVETTTERYSSFPTPRYGPSPRYPQQYPISSTPRRTFAFPTTSRPGGRYGQWVATSTQRNQWGEKSGGQQRGQNELDPSFWK